MWTYTTLSAALIDYLEGGDEQTLEDNIPNIVQIAEDKILKAVQLPDFRKNVTGSMTASDQYLGSPTDFLAPYSLALNNGGNYVYLLFKDVSFIRQAYPSAAATGVPKHYAIWDDDYFIVGPTPNTGYQVELHYFHRPESIVTAGTSWLGDHAPTALFYGALLESNIFQKSDQGEIEYATTQYNNAMEQLRILAEGRNKTDTYRSG